jgi:xeroderma pigmentosum group C-complementing protein
MLGLNELCDLFHARYKITSLGLHRPQWLAESAGLQNFELNERTEKPLELADFRRAATSMSGSADMGAQLFCCLLRALGVETRLVFSLQPLGFASAADLSPPSATTTSLKRTLYLHDLDDAPKVPTTANVDDVAPKRITRIGQPRTIDTMPVSTRSLSYSDQSSRIERPLYPVFWIEALNAVHQKWVAVDALCTHTVGKPSRLEPGINDVKNSLTYVIAYEEDGVARDVTRRYTKAFAAKTRKLRVESTEHGQAWLRKAMTLFRRPKTLDRDAQEDAELTAKAAQEGMPKNVADFRGHPLYALERHIRRNEVIHPKVESGKINVGTAMKPRFELVYRRQNVHVVKSADKWFRLGREVKVGEVPLKTSMPRRGTRAHQSPMEEDEEVPVGVGMYAVFQTQLYVPPPITRDGMVPRNRYGNIDVYVPSMIPEGGVWVRMPEAKHAAKLLKIDYADAVTGFDFKGRHGTARIDGVVVAEQHFEAMEQTCDALREGREEDLLANRRREAVRMWKRFLVGLREVDRIDGYLRDADKVEASKARERNDTQEEEDGGAGGFVADEEDGARSARRTRSQHIHSHPVDSGGGFLAESGDESDGGGGFLADSNDGDGGSGGGFVPDDDDEGEEEGGGGFLPDRKDTTFRIGKSQELSGAKEDTNKRTTDDTPFGFANIRIPHLGKSISEMAQDRDFELPRIVRGIRRPQQALLETTEDINMMDDGALAHNATEDTSTKAVTKLPPHASVQPEECAQASVADLNINGTESQAVPEAETKNSQDEAGQANSVTGSPSASKSAVGAVVNTAANTAIQSEDELPKSSYEYDDDLLDEDPEDADAEPEWLL